MIAYKLEDALYLNITNRCTNRCNFCIREKSPGVGGYDLWLKEEPSTKEIIQALGDPSGYREVVFCGYGEPLLRPAVVVDVAKYIKENFPGTTIRINTNGQANLIQGEDITPKLEGLIDIVSISLNAENADKYIKICNPEYGEEAYFSLLEFARKCKNHVPKVILTVVNIPGIDIKKCRDIAIELEVEFRIREYIS